MLKRIYIFIVTMLNLNFLLIKKKCIESMNSAGISEYQLIVTGQIRDKYMKLLNI